MKPALTLVLPGTWVQVPVGDHAQEEQLLALVAQAQGPRSADGWRDRLTQLAGLGGDQLLVSTTDPASVLVTSWPHHTAHDGDGLLAAARALGDARVLPHREHWPAVKVVLDAPDGTAAAYLVAHPRTGRVLALEVSLDVPDFEHPRWHTFDRLVGDLEWSDDESGEVADAARR